MVAEFLKASLAEKLLLAGGALGLVLAMWVALGVGASIERYSDAIATVDGAPISRTAYDTAIEGLASAKRNPLTDAEKRAALERIIDEELLLKRAIDLGLAETDPPSRKSLVSAMLQFTISGSEAKEPGDAELISFYESRPKLISAQPQLIVRAVSFADASDPKAGAFHQAIKAGKSFSDAQAAHGGDPVLLPGGAVTPPKIAEYAGATVRDVALSLEKGSTSGPVQIGKRAVFVHLIDRLEAPPPPFEVVRDLVLEEWRKREAEKAFEEYVSDLRAKARISYAGDAPAATE